MASGFARDLAAVPIGQKATCNSNGHPITRKNQQGDPSLEEESGRQWTGNREVILSLMIALVKGRFLVQIQEWELLTKTAKLYA